MDYSFYITIYCGNLIAEEDWERLSARAEERLTRYENLYTITYFDTENGRNKAICALAEVIQSQDTVQSGGAVASVSVGSVSTTYATADGSGATLSRSALAAIRIYADIYRGNSNGA